MKHTLEIHYSIRNGGDGSASPEFMESAELASWDQGHMDEGWGEDCSGSIEFESDSPIICKEKITTKESYLIRMINYGEDYEEFKGVFFPEGLPKFTVVTEDAGSPGYLYNKVYLGEKEVAKIFKRESDSGKVFEEKINRA
jgi:hypothetical protein